MCGMRGPDTGVYALFLQNESVEYDSEMARGGECGARMFVVITFFCLFKDKISSGHF